MICPRTSMGSGLPASIRGSSRAWAASRAVYMTPVMRTRSPALSDSTSASLSGGATSLIPSAATVIIAPHPSPLPRGERGPRTLAPEGGEGRVRGWFSPSQHGFFVAVGVALDGDGHRQARDVAGVREDVDAEGGGVAAVALRADTEPVGALEHFLLDGGYRRIGVGRAKFAEERLLAEPRGLLEGAARSEEHTSE